MPQARFSNRLTSDYSDMEYIVIIGWSEVNGNYVTARVWFDCAPYPKPDNEGYYTFAVSLNQTWDRYPFFTELYAAAIYKASKLVMF